MPNILSYFILAAAAALAAADLPRIDLHVHLHGIGEIEYCIRTARQCGLTKNDIWVPAERSEFGSWKNQ
jgi:hypothetical protein